MKRTIVKVCPSFNATGKICVIWQNINGAKSIEKHALFLTMFLLSSVAVLNSFLVVACLGLSIFGCSFCYFDSVSQKLLCFKTHTIYGMSEC